MRDRDRQVVIGLAEQPSRHPLEPAVEVEGVELGAHVGPLGAALDVRLDGERPALAQRGYAEALGRARQAVAAQLERRIDGRFGRRPRDGAGEFGLGLGH